MVLKAQNRVVLAAILGMVAAAGPARAVPSVSPAMPYCVGVDQVAAALVARGISIQPDQVEFLVSAKSSRPDPALEIERLQMANRGPQQTRFWFAGAGDSMLARFHCRKPGECLPFYVVLHLSGTQDAQAMLARSLATARPVSAVSHLVRPKWVVRSGQRATFVLQGKEMRATTLVICLQDGRQGESIRVSSLDRSRMMVGEVVGPGLLHGAL